MTTPRLMGAFGPIPPAVARRQERDALEDDIARIDRRPAGPEFSLLADKPAVQAEQARLRRRRSRLRGQLRRLDSPAD